MTKIETYINILKIYQQRSTCARKQVSSLIIKDDHIVSQGYNGTPPGFLHCNTYFDSKTNKAMVLNDLNLLLNSSKYEYDTLIQNKMLNSEIVSVEEFNRRHHIFSEAFEIHSEINAISYAAKVGRDLKDCTMFVSLSPCENCAKAIIAAGIKEVFYLEKYDRSPEGILRLEQNGIACKKLNEDLCK